jgi:hypothetical protein
MPPPRFLDSSQPPPGNSALRILTVVWLVRNVSADPIRRVEPERAMAGVSLVPATQ